MGFPPAPRALRARARTVAALLAVALSGAASADPALPGKKAGLRAPPAAAVAETAPASEPMVERLIVTPHPTRGGKLAAQLEQRSSSRLSNLATVPLSVERKLSARSHLLRLERPMTVGEARALAAQLRASGEVEAAEPDLLMQPQVIAPNDPGFATWPGQWHYLSPGGANAGGADLPPAWAMTLGSGNVNVAVLDTGVRPHRDLAPLLPGYDFISTAAVANDGGGRDADPSDPGDYTVAGECGSGSAAKNSSWHGTHVIGTIGALMDNGLYGTGVAPSVRLLPVRVLGRCGGYTSDIVDALRWAAGIDVAGVPRNANPARVINLSLGSAGSCSAAFQTAVNEVNARGAIVVVATGNGGASAVNQPANCSGVVAVTAHAIDGDNADYANIGAQTAISAPGGGCGTIASACIAGYTADGPAVYSLGNTGTSVPLADSAALKLGTSMAAPHVSGTIALMLSMNPQLTRAEIVSLLRSSARAFPANSACLLPENSGLCGAGLLDAQAALTAIAPVVQAVPASQVVAPGASVFLSGSAQPPAGRSIAGYQWQPAASNPSPVTLSNATTANAGFTAPATGTYAFTLQVADSSGAVGTANATVRVNNVPVPASVPAQQVPFGGTLRLQLSATDADGDAIVYHAASLPAGASLSSSGLLSWAGAAPVGDTAIVWQASDTHGSSLPGRIDITVTDASAGASAAAPAGGGGGAVGGDLLLWLAGALAIGRRLRRP